MTTPSPYRERSAPTRRRPWAALRASAALALALAALAGPPAEGAGAGERPDLAAVQELIDAERTEEALALLDPLLRRRPDDAAALLLRSTAYLMLGDTEAGRADLDRSLALDPEQRRGWLNRAALEVAEGRYEGALQAFQRAEALDPQAPENDLNIGAVELLAGRLQPASQRFAAYLGRPGATADDYYLVATNYALAGYAALAVEHLRDAIARDERARLRARTDPNFQNLASQTAFAALMSTDAYRPPEGAYTASQAFALPYDPRGGGLLTAVIDALQLAGRSFDPRVEVTERWALIWGELRIKVSNTLGGKGLLELSAPADRMTPAQWQQQSEGLLRDVSARVLATPTRPG